MQRLQNTRPCLFPPKVSVTTTIAAALAHQQPMRTAAGPQGAIAIGMASYVAAATSAGFVGRRSTAKRVAAGCNLRAAVATRHNWRHRRNACGGGAGRLPTTGDLALLGFCALLRDAQALVHQ